MLVYMDMFQKIIRNSGIKLRGKRRNFGSYDIVEPAVVSPIKDVPDHIIKPHYYTTGDVLPGPENPEIKNNDQIDGMKKSCRLASLLLKNVGEFIKIGATTDEIDIFLHEKCIELGAYPSPLRYRGFPKSVCTSVNNVACHGIPDSRKLINGDIINVDITVYFNGYHGDCSKTFLVGEVDDCGKELVAVTEECLLKGISVCGPGVPFKEIGNIIVKHAAKYGFTVIPAFLGHGIGTYFHGPPDIYHTRNFYLGKMEAGMTFTIEPALTPGSEIVEILEDGWTVVTSDNARSAQAEHTVLIVENGYVVLTDQH